MKNGRLKGHNFERQMCKEMREIGYPDCITKREARGGDWQFTDDGRDLVGTPGLAIQCKRLNGYVPVNTIEEIVDYPAEQEIHIVITKANNKDTMAILPWEDLKKLLRSSKQVWHS